nr:hypothetical protein [Metamycoplasma hominis]
MLHTINANFMIKEATNGLVLVKLSPEPLSSSNGNSENAYMSEEGIWIVYAATSTSISNIKLVLIDESNSPKIFSARIRK